MATDTIPHTRLATHIKHAVVYAVDQRVIFLRSCKKKPIASARLPLLEMTVLWRRFQKSASLKVPGSLEVIEIEKAYAPNTNEGMTRIASRPRLIDTSLG